MFCFHYRRQGQTWKSAWVGPLVSSPLTLVSPLPDAHPPCPVFSATPSESQLGSGHPPGGNRCPPQRAGGWESTTHSWASPHHCWWPSREGARVRGVALVQRQPPPHPSMGRPLTCTKVMYTLSTSGRSSRSTFTQTKSSLSSWPISSFWKDSSSIIWHQWQVEYPTRMGPWGAQRAE